MIQGDIEVGRTGCRTVVLGKYHFHKGQQSSDTLYSVAEQEFLMLFPKTEIAPS